MAQYLDFAGLQHYTDKLKDGTLVVGKAKEAESVDKAPWSGIENKPEEFKPEAHNQGADTIDAMTGYSKPATGGAILATDSLNAAIGKLEKKVEDAVAGGGELNVLEGVQLDGTPLEITDTKQVNIPVATDSKAGVMSANDKSRLDGIYEGNKALPAVSIAANWKFYKNDGTTAVAAADLVPAPNARMPVLEVGYKAEFTGTCKWTHDDSKKDPVSAATNSNWAIVPASGTASDEYTTGVVSANTTVRAKFEAPKTGMMVSGTSVVPASGNDATEATVSVTFKSRLFFGYSEEATPTADIIKGLGAGELVTSPSCTKNGITAESTQYFYFAYPKALGALTKIIQDGATPVLGAFTSSEVTVVNAAGYSQVYLVYRSNNPGAFTNASLQFTK